LNVILGVGAATSLFAVTGVVSTYIYGGNFESLPIVLRWLSVAVVFVYGNNLCGVALNALGLEKVNMWIVGAGTLTNIVLNLFLIPVFGFIAAAQITVVTEAVVLISEFVYLTLYLNKRIVAEPVKILLADQANE
jgi:O-antigen/teichoic acid export membrane protein